MTDRREKLILSNEDVNNNGVEKNVFSFADLPSCLLEIIMSYLLLKDNIRASAVCKAWRKAAESVRVVGKHPWVITFPLCDDFITFLDPLERKRYTLNLPELARTDVCYSKDGWLLMRISSLVDMFFFSPYTRELINLPKCKLAFLAIAFSSAPTSGTCALVALRPFTRYIVISVCYPGATEWITQDFSCPLGFDPYMHSNLVYDNDHFYCFSSGVVLVDFDLASRTMSHQAWNEHRCPYIHNDEWFNLPKRIYLTEEKGELFLMYTCSCEIPMVYKLVSSNWEEISSTTLDGVTIFASLYSSETRLDVVGMRNSVYFPKYGLHCKGCVSYSFDEGMYYPPKKLPKPTKLWQMQKELCPLRSLWIEPPPKNILDSMK